jgi:phage repressor protein C with HTH and peptisase S24 domain
MFSAVDIYNLVEKRRKELGLSQDEVGLRAFGKLDNTAIQSLRKGSSPGFDRVAALASALDLELYLGPARTEPAETVVSIEGDVFSAVPLYGAQASAGPGAENASDEVEDLLAFRQDWLSKLNVKGSHACLLRIRGESMTPTLQPGDLALIDRGRKKVRTGRAYAFVDIDGQTRIKRIDRPDGDTMVLRSDNLSHPSEVRRGNDLNRMVIIGEVIWSGHTWT